MDKKVKRTIEKYNMLSETEGETIVVGVSGGADSLALLHVLKNMGLSLKAVHVHHGLRGEEADRDRAFVEDVCKKWGIPCLVFNFDVRQEAKNRGMGEEEAGRLLRYETFYSVAQGGRIAVAHNLNDQAETMLMRLCRGTGMAGMGGIRPVRGQIIRPLLYCTRAEIEGYCRLYGLEYCTDSTNSEETYTRNRIRHSVLPVLEEIYPRGAEHMGNMAELFAAEEDFLSKETEKRMKVLVLERKEDSISLKAEELKKEHEAIIKRVIRSALGELGARRDITIAHVEGTEGLLYGESGKSVSLPYGLWAFREYDRLVIAKKGKEQGFSSSFSYKLTEDDEIYIPEAGASVIMRLYTEKNNKNICDDCTKVFDYDKIKGEVFCRSRQKGDRIAIKGGTKKLKDIFIDEKIPGAERNRQPLIAVGNDILWIVGKRLSEHYRADEDTRRFIAVTVRRNTSNE